jgi:hypothetical protein
MGKNGKAHGRDSPMLIDQAIHRKPQKANGVSRRILRWMQALEELPAHNQKSILNLIGALVAQRRNETNR